MIICYSVFFFFFFFFSSRRRHTRCSRDWSSDVCSSDLLGFFSIVFMASCNTTLQLSAPDALRGRVMSFYTLAFGGAFPLGAFMIGAIAEALGVRTALVVAGSAGLVGMAAVVLRWVSTRTRAPR